MQRSIIETVMGGVVLAVAGFFLYVAYQTTDLSRDAAESELTARFGAVDGLILGSDVRIAGVKVGTVIGQAIDPELFEAVVTMSIESGLRIPEDSKVSIASDGLLGGRYLRIEPGQSDSLLADGGRFLETQDVIALEDLLGRAIFLITED